MTVRNNTPVVAMTIWEHIAELRSKLLVCFFAIIFFSIVAHYFHEPIIGFLLSPVKDNQLFFLSPLDPLFFIFKIDLLIGLIASLPIINWAIVSFIRPAIKSFTWMMFSFIYLTVVLFIVLALAYSFLVVAPISLNFLLSIKVGGITNMITASSYMSFLLTQILIIAIIFQIPPVMAACSYVGLFDVQVLAKKRRHVYLLGLIVLSVITPTTDLFNLSIVAAPALVIFEGSLLMSRLIQRYKRLKVEGAQ